MVFAYASKWNLLANINFFKTKFYNFIYPTRRKTLTIYKQTITKEYKVRIFNDYVEITCFIQT